MTKIHVGCGKRQIPGWVHVDGAKHPHVNHCDIWLSHMHEENSVSIIYASHLLEYFDRQEGLIILKEWYKVLKPGGTLRIAVPDFEALAAAYEFHDYKLSDIIGPLFGRMDMGGHKIYHRITFDFDSLDDLLTEAGFKNIHKYDWRQTEHAHIDDHSHAHLPHDPEAIRTGNFTDKHILISLNVEATK